MQNIHLIGTEDVRAAGAAMREAGNDMQRAANNIDGSLHRNMDRLEYLVARFETCTTQFSDAVERLITEARRGKG